MTPWRFALNEFIQALAFLTRLVPARACSSRPMDELGRSLSWFPAVGLAIGAILLAPLSLLPQPRLQAWLLLAGGLWATRGLHHDGVADLGDAWGSSASGDRFWHILKDSRIGAFGVMALFLCLSAQLLLYEELFALRAWGPLVFSFCAGRWAAVLLCRLARDLERPGLGAIFIRAATPKRVALASLAVLLTGAILMPPAALLLTTLFLAPGLAFLSRLGRKNGGLNGDFLGCAILYGELCACLAALVP